MKLIATLSSSFALLLAVACSVETTSPGTGSTSSSGGSSSGASSTSSSSSGSSSTSSSSGSTTSSSSGSTNGGPITGTVNGKPFTFSSGIAKLEGNTTDLVFSSKPDLCTASADQKFRSGEIFIQLFGLTSEAGPTGEVTTEDMKFAEIGTCTSGAPIEEADVAGASRAKATSKVTIKTRTETQVTGTIDLTFEDGSTAKGDFDVAACANSLGEDPVCF